MTAVLLTLLICAADAHEDRNALYKEVRAGVVVGASTLSLPPPALPDGLDARQQLIALSRGPGLRVPLDELLRDALGAPFVLDVGDLTTLADGTRVRPIDLTFTAQGDLNDRADFALGDAAKLILLSKEDLARRNLAAADDTRYGHVVLTLLDRVRLSMTQQVVVSRGDESIVAAAKTHPAFHGDAQFPNEWREIAWGRLGAARLYGAVISYVKCTALKGRPGAILIEYHALFEQPEAWFGGRDLLRSKLPIAVQRAVRGYREELRKASNR